MIDELKAWSGLISGALAIGAMIYTWLTAGGKQAQAGVAALKDKIEEDREKAEMARQKQGDAIVARFQAMEGRLLKIEGDLTHLPDRKQLHDVLLSIERLTGQMAILDARMTGRMDTISERLKPVEAISERVQELMVEQAAGK